MVTAAPQSRPQLIEQHLDLAKTLALKLHRRLPPMVDLEELESDAYLGLIQAADAFRPDKGASFRTYAGKRISGAMIDGLRQRGMTRRVGGKPNVCSLDTVIKWHGGRGITLGDTVVADDPPVGERLADLDEAERGLEELDLRSRQHVRDRYYHGKTQKQIAQECGVSPSRISQRLASIHKVLADQCQEAA